MAYLTNSTNVLTDTILTYPLIFGASVDVLPSREAPCYAKVGSNYYKTIEDEWVLVGNATAFMKERQGVFLNLEETTVTASDLIDILKQYDTATNGSVIKVLKQLPSTVESNWIVQNQETLNLQFLLTIKGMLDALSSSFGDIGDYESLLTLLKQTEDAIADIRSAITEKSSDPGTDVRDYAEAIRDFTFIPYKHNIEGETEVSLVGYPGYFLNTMVDVEGELVPNQENTITEVAGNWSTGHTMYYNGDFKATRVMNAVWNDYAEFFEKDDINYTWEEGDVISVNPETGKYRLSTGLDDKYVVGVASENFGSIVGGEFDSIEDNYKKYIPIALAGRVYVKTDYDATVGDVLVASRTPGFATFADEEKCTGLVLGRVIEIKDGKAIMLVGRS